MGKGLNMLETTELHTLNCELYQWYVNYINEAVVFKNRFN